MAATPFRQPSRSIPKAFEYRSLVDEPPPDWIADNLPKGAKLAYDPWMHTASGVEALQVCRDTRRRHAGRLHRQSLDAVWDDQPAAPLGAVSIQPLEYAGEASQAKRDRIASTLRDGKTDAAVITLPGSIAWLLNIRGERRAAHAVPAQLCRAEQ